jgi:hypothetical protein
MQSSLLPILLPVLVLFVVAAVVLVVFFVVRKQKDDRAPQKTAEATVLEKHTSVQRHPVAGDASGGHGYTTFTSYHVSFLLAGGEQITLYVDGETYASLSEGDRGRLTVQGTRLIGFLPDA